MGGAQINLDRPSQDKITNYALKSNRLRTMNIKEISKNCIDKRLIVILKLLNPFTQDIKYNLLLNTVIFYYLNKNTLFSKILPQYKPIEPHTCTPTF